MRYSPTSGLAAAISICLGPRRKVTSCSLEAKIPIAELAQKYINAEVISPNHLLDAEHIAVATVEKADIVVSWNFKHIVNIHKIRGFNSVNLKEGYQLIEIRTPMEVINED